MSKTADYIKEYIHNLNKEYKTGKATEHSYRPALKSLLENITEGLTVTNEPTRMGCGAPDYAVTRKEISVGYIETKRIEENLNDKKHKEQFERYKKQLSNLIITNYITFQLFEHGELIVSATIAKEGKKGFEINENELEDFIGLISKFAGYDGQILTSAHLSKVMAAKARLLANIIEDALGKDEELGKNIANSDSALYEQLKGFREVLIHEMAHREFADIYAQTIAYGMFAAKLNDKTKERFSRFKAAQLIPHSNPFLRKLFQYIAGNDLDERIQWVVEDLADLFNHVDIDGISKEFDKTDHDPMIHFYETFLAEYDPALRKSRGVWYTPQPVVKFIVKAVDNIIKEDFDLTEGLADTSKVKLMQSFEQNDNKFIEEEKEYHRVQILDPATGTGTFLAEVVQNIYQRFRNNKGMWQGYADEHLIPRINGFEILMASYAMAHLKLDMLLQQTDYKPSNKERLHIYLTNSLDRARPHTKAPLAQWLSNEANEANHIKQNIPVMVVLGNPPYSGESQNSGEWIMKQIGEYKREPQYQFKNRSKKEKNIPDTKWINNDYVKFIRFGQYFIEKNGVGTLAYITDNSFLDSLSFRGMRYNLMHTFDKIYILNLHGNSLKKETAPDGSKDENVFDIMQGVSINIFVKTASKRHCGLDPQSPPATIFYYDLYGKREDKYSFLLNNDLQKIEWKELQPPAPNYFFVPKDFSLQEEYDTGFKIDELFSLNGVGICSKRDDFTIHETKEKLINTIKEFLSLNDEEARTRFNLGKDTDWKLSEAKKDLTNKPDFSKIATLNYRPFDTRFTYHSNKKGFHARPVYNIMQHFTKGDNIGLVVGKQCDSDWRYVFITSKITDLNLIATAAKFGGGYIFPLYLFQENDSQTRSYDSKVSNLKPKMVKFFAEKIGLQFDSEEQSPPSAGAGGGSFTPINLFDYIYAILHSPAYRERYKEFLKIDFPRVPYPENAEQFWKLVALGEKLRRLHLMEKVEPQKGVANFPIVGNNEVNQIRHAELVSAPRCNEEIAGLLNLIQCRNDDDVKRNDSRVYINNTQYFDNVPLVAWNFYIGGYQPAQKWLKDRKGRKLEYDDIVHYQKIIWVLMETGEVMDEIDKVINQ
jgi:predicted helicase